MSDVPPNFRREILDAIEGLRNRKTRPNETGIIKFVNKKYGHSLSEVAVNLERLVDDDAVQKVDYKGSVSYRDTSTWIHAERSQAMQQLPVQFGCLLNSEETTKRIMDAVTTLSNSPLGSTSSQMVPLPREVIDRHLQAIRRGTKLTGDHLMKCLLREVDIGRLVQLTNDAFVLADRVDKTAKIKREGLKRPPQKSKNLLMKVLAKKSGNVKRSGGRFLNLDEEAEPEPHQLKKFKPGVRISPSQKFPKFSNTFPNGKRPKRHCFECVDNVGMDEARSGFLLECTVCSYAGHPSCTGYSEETVQLITSSFTCIQCKSCKICGKGKLGEDSELILCIRCDNSFHYNSCHIPPITVEQATKANWRCADCKLAIRSGKAPPPKPAPKKISEPSPNTVFLVSGVRAESSIDSEAETNDHSDERRKNIGVSNKTDDYISRIVLQAMKCLEQSLPPQKTTRLVTDIETWTVDDVAKRFEQNGKISFAEAIRKQEIDGPALMLIAREDVISRFGLPFVDALNLYREICLLCPFGPYSQ